MSCDGDDALAAEQLGELLRALPAGCLEYLSVTHARRLAAVAEQLVRVSSICCCCDRRSACSRRRCAA